MTVIEHIEKARGPFVTVEIIPPRRGGNVQAIYKAIESILPYHPPFIDVTSHAADVIWEELADGTYRRRVKRRAPGTFGICAVIKYKYEIDPVPHLLCNGFTREETEDALIELHYIGIENLLLIRGDGEPIKDIPPYKSVNTYAVELVEQVANMNRGIYLDEITEATPTNFCIGVAAYPEKHYESPNLRYDLLNLKRKQDAGANYAVTQMFFDNNYYYHFVKAAREMGITIPIIPGLKILTSPSHLHSLPKNFHITLPDELVDRVLYASSREEVVEIGVDWAYQQALGLLEFGVPCIHFYIMQNTQPFLILMEKLKKHIYIPA
jgi:methylenetetrahydrofolate reductase (NADPH)